MTSLTSRARFVPDPVVERDRGSIEITFNSRFWVVERNYGRETLCAKQGWVKYDDMQRGFPTRLAAVEALLQSEYSLP